MPLYDEIESIMLEKNIPSIPPKFYLCKTACMLLDMHTQVWIYNTFT